MWTVQLLGGLIARGVPDTIAASREVTRFRTQKAASLFAYLAYHNAPGQPPHPRETLTVLLWPDASPDAGRHSLSSELTSLRQALEPHGITPGAVIVADRFTVRLNPETVSCDAWNFERTAMAGLGGNGKAHDPDRLLSLLCAACDLYAGRFLPGFYEDWVAPEAERMASLFHRAACTAVEQLLQAGDPASLARALAYAERVVTADPLSEEAVTCLLRALAANGQPTRVADAFHRYSQRLQDEAGEEPTDAMRALVTEASHGQRRGVSVTAGAVVSPTIPVTPPIPSFSLSSLGTLGRLTLTRFFGREADIAFLTEMLCAPDTRLVTVTGPGGAGKTRLALETALRLMQAKDDIPDGSLPFAVVQAIPLVEITNPASLSDHLLRAMGVTPSPNRDRLEQTAETLAKVNALLILDNFEQIVEEGAPYIADLMSRLQTLASTARLLVTSRIRLQIGAEREFRLAPLAIPGGRTSLEALRANPSVALFVDRAQAATPTFTLTRTNAADVADLIDRLEGLPLAIELAAARAAVLTPAQIRTRVESARLDALASPRRDGENRHRTLRATLDWSYELLTEDARLLLADLSVFRDGWTYEAAEAVCSLQPGFRLLDSLTQLRDASLINVTDDEDGPRFSLLETVREYAAERLSAQGPDVRNAVCNRHMDYVLRLADTECRGLGTADRMDTARRLEREQGNFRAALEWGHARREWDRCARLASGLTPFWLMSGYVDDTDRWLDTLQAEAGLSPSLRIVVLGQLVAIRSNQQRMEESGAFLNELIALQQRTGDEAGLAFSLFRLAFRFAIQGKLSDVRRVANEAIERGRAVGRDQTVGRCLDLLANVASAEGDYAEASRLNAEAILLFRRVNDPHCLGSTLITQGGIAVRTGDMQAARHAFEENLDLRHRIGDRAGVGIALINLGVLDWKEEQRHAAEQRLREAITVLTDAQWRGFWMITTATAHLCDIRRALGDRAGAESLARERLAVLRQEEVGDVSDDRLLMCADLAVSRGQSENAAHLLGAALARGCNADMAEPLQREIRREWGEDVLTTGESVGRTLTDEQVLVIARTVEEGESV